MSTVGNQMIEFDFDFDNTEPTIKKLQKCECGSWAIGIKDFMTGHDPDCPVHEDKTPLSR